MPHHRIALFFISGLVWFNENSRKVSKKPEPIDRRALAEDLALLVGPFA
jgi:hypothetical protein